MFTGIVTECGQITHTQRLSQSKRIHVRPERTSINDFLIGESIAIQGACLTIAGIAEDNEGHSENSLVFEISPETLARTTLGSTFERVNMERALRLSDRLSGHLVSGHIDTTTEVIEVFPHPDGFFTLTLALPKNFEPYLVTKGSLCIDGVSLTINAIENESLKLQIIPHTWKETTLSSLHSGSRVNVEFDLIAKHLEKLCQPYLKPLND